MWTVDFKGWWWRGHYRCEPLTVRDEYSRYLLELRAVPDARQILSKVVYRGRGASLLK